MSTHIPTENQVNDITIKIINPQHAKDIFESPLINFPQWFKTPSAKKRFEAHAHNIILFSAYIDHTFAGLAVLELATQSNAHIILIQTNQESNFDSVASRLLCTVENYCYENGYSSLTVETPSLTQGKDHQLYNLYITFGYTPLIEMYPYDEKQIILYLQKTLSLDDFTFIDLTHTLSADVPHWGVDAAFKYNARTIQSAEANSDVHFRVQRLEMSSGIGTHLDAPSHCYETADAIDKIPLQSLITPCRVINVAHKADENYSVSVDDINQFENKYGIIPKNCFVIVYTGWSKRWEQGEKYRNEKIFPNISVDAAKLLVERDIVGLGIDTLSPDAFGSDFPVHQLILSAGKYIVENVANADLLDPVGNYTFALPIKIKDGTEAPMRLVGMKRRRR